MQNSPLFQPNDTAPTKAAINPTRPPQTLYIYTQQPRESSTPIGYNVHQTKCRRYKPRPRNGAESSKTTPLPLTTPICSRNLASRPSSTSPPISTPGTSNLQLFFCFFVLVDQLSSAMNSSNFLCFCFLHKGFEGGTEFWENLRCLVLISQLPDEALIWCSFLCYQFWLKWVVFDVFGG